MTTSTGVSSALRTLPDRLREIGDLARATARRQAASPLASARRNADVISAQIERAASEAARRFRTVGFRVEAPDLGVVRAVRGRAADPDPPEFDVRIDITASAQVGGFLLSMGSPTGIDLGGRGPGGFSDQFIIRIEGALGAQELSFASGTSTADIAATINSRADVTGVLASTSGADGGIRLESTRLGADAFVSVQVIDDGGIANADGVFALDPGNANAIDPASPAVAFAAAYNALIDFGQDVVATVNGRAATGRGAEVRIDTAQYDFRVELTRSAAQSLGERYAFRFVAAPVEASRSGPQDALPLPLRLYA